MKRNNRKEWLDWMYWIQMHQILCDRCIVPVRIL